MHKVADVVKDRHVIWKTYQALQPLVAALQIMQVRHDGCSAELDAHRQGTGVSAEVGAGQRYGSSQATAHVSYKRTVRHP